MGQREGQSNGFFSVTLQEWLCPALHPAESGTWHSRASLAKTGWRGNGNGAGAIRERYWGGWVSCPKSSVPLGTLVPAGS